MFDFRPILFIVGILLTTLSIAMVLPAIVDAIIGHPDWRVFLASAGLTLFIGQDRRNTGIYREPEQEIIRNLRKVL